VCVRVCVCVRACVRQHVTQNPTDLIEAVGHTVRFECLHNIEGYNQILLYRQRGLSMQLIGYISEAGKTCKIIISELHPNISGVYYCAASYHGCEAYMGYEVFFGAGTRLTDS
uniref:Immunoglobulin subtype domain-containing protein n=1 Tax=Hippocampus comes TaxID=109280 RepID=A0A3Q3DLI4_HIPCM